MIKALTLVVLVVADIFTAGGAIASHKPVWSIWAVLLWIGTAAFVTVWAAHKDHQAHRVDLKR